MALKPITYMSLYNKSKDPKTNHLTKFHEERTVNLASRVLTSHKMKNDPPRGGHIFQRTGTIFKLVQDIIGTNLLAYSHDDRTIKLASRVLTRPYALLPGNHVFQPTSRVLTRFYYSHIWPYY
ncbi:hypothetical protein DPMN_018594 [Dreissena polymorpha]|uniref:Uncharacterized protein n=1 Tax=Dreissena polymorpha TaxID=45954 RepID=A0A9D4S9C2_DREPO|nr:hypothetical protein DPMN_018594 [Dreissena polymorpha]